jgi:hypothetical protein
MTTEEKLKTLLQVAFENGWKIEDECMLNFYKLNKLLCFYRNSGSHTEYFSISEIVTSFEEDEISFIDALCIASSDYQLPQSDGDGFAIGERSKQDSSLIEWSNTYKVIYAVEWIRIQWALTPDSQKLSKLFEIFKHLLNK